jgi:hypothetical protein
MEHRMRVAVAAVATAVVAAVAVAVGAGPAGAGQAEAAVDGWIVDNPDPDGMFETYEGSVTITNVTSGAAVSCPVLEGWGSADSRTLRPQDVFGETGFTTYGYEGGGCTAPTPITGVVSSPGMVFHPETYDAGADRVDGSAYPWLWASAIEAPDCWIDMYAVDSDAAAPLTYDNGTGTLDLGPVVGEVTAADGAGCAALAQVGDSVTFETTLVATPVFTVHPF